ncbi:hypothetical protein ASU31_18010 [Pedobacter ginsenosidimutans]|uniref:Uncharacterized protein n=1 Tax=Pedobacter ginsenosidimutans TaxID=687842 RepID=A0A0T5VLT2_9SPHI|nr:hypothetical protein ASU31_18010 [Pedobacter ginsenosidimutans]
MLKRVGYFFKSNNYRWLKGKGLAGRITLLHKSDRMNAVFHGRKHSGAGVTDELLLSFSNYN